MRTSGRHVSVPVQRPIETLNHALVGDARAVSSLLHAGWTLWISPAILQGKRGIVELRFQSTEGRERYSIPVLTFLTMRDEGTIVPQSASPDDLWVRCTLSERAIQPETQEAAPKTVASSAA
jgi:hypothetical protein